MLSEEQNANGAIIDLVSHLNCESAFKDTQLVAISPWDFFLIFK